MHNISIGVEFVEQGTYYQVFWYNFWHNNKKKKKKKENLITGWIVQIVLIPKLIEDMYTYVLYNVSLIKCT